MADATTIKGGKVRVLLGTLPVDPEDPIVYAAPCGFTSKTVTLSKALEDTQGVSCTDPDAVSWLLRDAVSLSISVSGEGVLAVESLPAWLAAWKDVDSVPVKIEVEMPTTLLTFTGNMHVESMEWTAPNGRRVTANISMQSDGAMADVTTP
ncbi:hypothetical protein VW29_02620 [Devosia limi DSM 17137]|uniref:Phage tail tube protein n=1 Tax=Devosia limi DSM 17137 TaxID=1121477 RepID=A0A0F5LWI9_9HYPH|nr:phage tail tube protein [Devosia limi]KKB86539.1 hypothetical protein VW29_02620 [Devosia limi DSM 17137]SHE87804.1 Phage tail tube protein [Devosia limi DSM 17137]